jgi:6-methylsalicylate decarboxylase
MNRSEIRRREFLALAGSAAVASPAERARIIDVHHHILPPEYVKAVGTRAIGAPAGRTTAPEWTPQASIEAMDQIGIETALTSISAPGIVPQDRRGAAKLARSCNEYAARLASDHKGRFGIFAAMPLPDVPATLGEIRYSFEALKTEGVGLLTSYDGRYLGDPLFTPVFEELNRRKAVVFVHPTPCICSAGVQTGLNPSAIEYPQDTTRTIVSLLFSGTLLQFPDIRFIFSHGGGTMPYVAGRIANRKDPRAPDVLGALQRLYYDVALSVNPVTVHALLEFAGAGQVVFGSDFPFASAEAVRTAAANLPGLIQDESKMLRVARENVLSLLPQLRR